MNAKEARLKTQQIIKGSVKEYISQINNGIENSIAGGKYSFGWEIPKPLIVDENRLLLIIDDFKVRDYEVILYTQCYGDCPLNDEYECECENYTHAHISWK